MAACRLAGAGSRTHPDHDLHARIDPCICMNAKLKHAVFLYLGGYKYGHIWHSV